MGVMGTLGLVVSAMVDGDRRKSTPQERRQWDRENGGASEPPGGGFGAILYWLPRSALVALILVMAAGFGWLGKGWIDFVNKQLEHGDVDRQRITAVEGLAAGTAADVIDVRQEVGAFKGEVRAELVETRRVLLEQWQWTAKIEGDRAQAEKIEAQLKALKR